MDVFTIWIQRDNFRIKDSPLWYEEAARGPVFPLLAGLVLAWRGGPLPGADYTPAMEKLRGGYGVSLGMAGSHTGPAPPKIL